jgi:WhiA C-terminal HTH domain
MSRKRKAGGLAIDIEQVAAWYAAGDTLREVGLRYDPPYHETTVQHLMRDAGIPRRRGGPRSVSLPPPDLAAANHQRVRQAAQAKVPSVEKALESLGERAPRVLAEAGWLRIRHPWLSLEELGKIADPPLTKDAIASRIRRLLKLAGLS